MGHYTELRCFGELRSPDPETISVLLFLAENGPAPKELPDHRFFECPRWPQVGRMDSYYFPATTSSSFIFDRISKRWALTIQCNLKDYDDEIEKFLDWLVPQLDDDQHGDSLGGLVGYYRYEDADVPTLVFRSEKGKPKHRLPVSFLKAR